MGNELSHSPVHDEEVEEEDPLLQETLELQEEEEEEEDAGKRKRSSQAVQDYMSVYMKDSLAPLLFSDILAEEVDQRVPHWNLPRTTLIILGLFMEFSGQPIPMKRGTRSGRKLAGRT